LWNYFRLLSGGLRYAATTGYYLTALQAEPTRYPRSGLKNSRARQLTFTRHLNVEAVELRIRLSFAGPSQSSSRQRGKHALSSAILHRLDEDTFVETLIGKYPAGVGIS